jgi:hypothetical protein
MRRRRFATGLAALLLTACATSPDAPAGKSGDGTLRTDLDPLLSRFAMLEGVVAAEWMSGTYGRGDAPGPSTYWIDAVVTLPADRVREWSEKYAATADGRIPDVVDGLRPKLPTGPFLTSTALNKEFAGTSWTAAAYLDTTADRLVLTATGS